MVAVLHIIPTLSQGGAERLLSGLVCRDQLNRHVVVKMFSGSGLFDADVARNCPRVFCLGLSRRLPLAVVMLPFAMVRLLWLIIALRPDVLVGWLYYGALASAVGRLLRIPIIWSLHAAEFNLEKSFKQSTRAAVRWCRTLARAVPQRVQYCSNESRVHHEKLGFPITKSQVIENGVDLERLSRAGAQETTSAIAFGSVTSGTMVIGCIARFEPQKDHRTLLKAVANLKAAGRKLVLVLAGRGCDRTNSELMELVEEFGLSEEVVPVGIVAESDRLIRHCDCTVLSSSEGEAMPLAVLESIALGRPVVSTNVGAAAEIIGDFGLVVPPRSHEALSQAIEQVLWIDSYYRHAAAEKGLAWIHKRYSLVTAIHSWNNMFAELAAGAYPK